MFFFRLVLVMLLFDKLAARLTLLPSFLVCRYICFLKCYLGNKQTTKLSENPENCSTAALQPSLMADVPMTCCGSSVGKTVVH